MTKSDLRTEHGSNVVRDTVGGWLPGVARVGQVSDTLVGLHCFTGDRPK